MKKFRVGILGAGRMAQGQDAPGSEQVLSMAHAFSRSEQFEIGGFFDLDPAAAARAETRWHVPVTPRDWAAWSEQNWDVFYIATPDRFHEQTLLQCLEKSPRGILMEKPLSTGLLAPATVEKILEWPGALLVNYPRRWHSLKNRIAALLETKEMGELKAVSGICSGGLLHNGSHILDFIYHWLGPFEKDKAGAPSSSRLLLPSLASGPVPLSILPLEGTDYAIWEFSLLFEKGLIRVEGSPEKMSLHRSVNHPQFEGFKVLQEEQSLDLEGESLLEKSVGAFAQLLEEPARAAAWKKLEMREHDTIISMFDSEAGIV